MELRTELQFHPDPARKLWNCPKHVDFDSKNKFEKLVHLVGFIIRIPFIILTEFSP